MNLIDVIRELVEATETCTRRFGGNDCDGRAISEQVFDDEKIWKAKAKGRVALANQFNLLNDPLEPLDIDAATSDALPAVGDRAVFDVAQILTAAGQRG